jgi:hypothetical protein
MRHCTIGAALSLTAVLFAGPAYAQSVVDFRNLKPREVRTTVFTVSAPQDFRVEAIGAEATRDGGTFSWITAMWRSKDDTPEPWVGNAWILDTASRQVVWELSAASTSRGDRHTRVFDGSVRLQPGTYEAFYASFPDAWSVSEGEPGAGQRFISWLSDQGFDQFRFTMQGAGRALTGVEADRALRQLDASAVVALHGDGGERFAQTGFALDRPAEVEIYAAGEARENVEFDTGWIINADTRQTVWKLTWEASAPAGGAVKNRLARVKKTLPAGRYAAFYATDDSHDRSEWNSPPPHDPDAWGLFIRVADPAARAAVKTFAYEHVPASAVIAAITKVHDDESLSKPFTLTRAMDVRVYALGEGSGNRLVDYGWIVNAAGQKVWEMRYDETQPAGGAAKNRLVDRTIRLEKGDYVLHYRTDDSHAYNDWNAAAPRDGERWGVTVLAADGGK